jgi:hypothetical protein
MHARTNVLLDQMRQAGDRARISTLFEPANSPQGRGGGDSGRRFGATQGAIPPRVVYGLEVQFGSVADFDPLLGSPPEVRREGVRSAV